MGRVNPRLAKSKIILIIYILLSVSVLALGYLYYFQQRKNLQNDINNDLKIIAELKVSEIQSWLHERYADANIFAQTPIPIVDLDNANIKLNEKHKNQLSKRINLFKEHYKYQDVILVDLNGKVLINEGNNFLQLGDETIKVLEEAKKKCQVTFSDLYWCSQCNKIHLDYIVPLVNEDSINKQILGYTILRIDPNDYLYPLINRWPTNSKTGETLLIRKDGDSALYINNIRHATNSALRLKIPLTRTNAPAVQGVLGHNGLYEGVDYQNKKVLSYTLQVPGTKWVLVSKIDTSEVYEPLRKQAWISGTILLLLLSLLGFTLVTLRVTDQKKYLKKLLETEIERKAIVSHFEFQFKYANDIIILLDKDFKIVEVNDKALAVYGYTRNEIIGLDGKRLRTDSEQTLIAEQTESIDTRGFDFYEAINKTKNGLEFPVEVSARLIEIEGNKYYQFIARDITEHKRAEQELIKAKEKAEESEEKYRALYNNAPLSYQSLDENGCFIDINPMWVKTLGYEKGEVIGKWYGDFLHPDYVEHFRKNFPTFKKRGYVSDVQFKLRRKDNTYIYVSFEGCIGYTPEGKFKQTYCVFKDITEQKALENALIKAKEKAEESEAKLSALFTTMSEMVALHELVFDENGKPVNYRITDCNDAFTRITGISRNAAVGGLSTEVYGTELPPYLREYTAVALTGEPYHYETYFEPTGKHFSISVISPEKNRFATITTDITERKKFEEKLKENLALLRIAGEQAKLGGWNVNLEENRSYWSDEVAAIHEMPAGYSPLVEDGINFYAPEWRERITNVFTNCAKNGIRYDEEMEIITATGKRVWIRTIGEAVRNTSGKIHKVHGSFQDITERKKAEAAQNRLLHIIDSSLNEIYIFDPVNLLFEYVNAGAIQNSGYSLEAMRSMTPVDLKPEFTETSFRQALDPLLQHKLKQLTLNTVNRRADGSLYSVKVHLQLVDYQDHQVFLAVAIDITEQKKIEDELKETEIQYRNLADSGVALIWTSDKNKLCNYFNEPWLKFTGRSLEMELGNGWVEGVHPDDVDMCFDTFVKAFDKREPFEMEYRLKHNSGEFRWIKDLGSPNFNGNGEFIGYIGHCFDITERMKSQEILNNYTNRLKNLHIIDQAILQAIESPETIVQTALLHIRDLLMSQRSSVGIFDFEKKEVRVFAADVDGKTIFQVGKILPEDVYGELATLNKNRIDVVEKRLKGELSSNIVQILQPEGIQSSINVPLISAQKLYGVLNVGWLDSRLFSQEELEIVEEVAGQITIAIEQAQLLQETRNYATKLEDRIKERTLQLETSNKELEAFSYSVSHDLRAPLRHVNGYVELLNKHFNSVLPEKAQHYLNSITNSVHSMGNLIDDLLQFSRMGRKDMLQTELNMGEIIQEVKESICLGISNRKIEWQLSKMPKVHGDRAMLQLVWINLINNAIKFTSTRKKAKIEIAVIDEKNQWVFFIKDNGVGFDMQYAHKLFGVFQRLHPSDEFEGTGIGLANVQRIVLRHGGRAWAEGEIDKGAKIYFSLPK